LVGANAMPTLNTQTEHVSSKRPGELVDLLILVNA
jgi:hypothetical protein